MSNIFLSFNASGTLLTGLAGYFASKTRDIVAHPKEIKA